MADRTVNTTAELKRLARRVAKTYGHELGAWDTMNYWDDLSEPDVDVWTECKRCDATLAIHHNDYDGAPYLSIPDEIVVRCEQRLEERERGGA